MSFKSLSEDIAKYLEERNLNNKDWIVCPESKKLCSKQNCKDQCLGDSDGNKSEEQKS